MVLRPPRLTRLCTRFPVTTLFRSSEARWSRLFLGNYALRIEIADAAACRAGLLVDHRVDEGRPAGIQRLAHGTVQLVGARHVDADPAEAFHHLVVARPLPEGGDRKRVG